MSKEKTVKLPNKKIFHHTFDENRERMQISFGDSYVTHTYDFLIHPEFSIESVKQILEDALLLANRKQDLKRMFE